MIPATEVAGNESRTGLDQPPRQQRALSPRMAAVPLASFVVLLREIEGLSRFFSGNEVERLPLEAVDGVERTAAIRFAAQMIELIGQAAAVVQAVKRELRRQAEIFHLEFWVVRITLGLERVFLGPQIVAAKITGPQANTHGVRDGDVGRHACLPWPEYLGRNRPEKRKLAGRRIATDAGPTARQHPVTACKVVAGAVGQRADDRELVGDLCLEWKQLGDFNA